MKRQTIKEVTKTQLKFQSSSVTVPLESDEHPNKLPFVATFMAIDKPSDGVPCGPVNKPILIPMDEAKRSIDSMKLMGIDCTWCDWCPEWIMTGHDTRNKIGVVEDAYIEGNEMKLKGIIYCNDFPDIAYFIKNATPALGFSMECISDYEESDENDYVSLENVTFTGVAILFANLAAYEDTYIEYIAAKRKDKDLDEKQMKEFMASIKTMIDESTKNAIKDLNEKLDGVNTKVEAFKASKNELKAEENDEFNQKIAELEAAKSEAEAKSKAAEEKLEQQKADFEAQRKTENKKDNDPKSIWAGKSYKQGMRDCINSVIKEIKEGK